MLAMGVIVPSQSPWAAPVVLVEKKDQTIRFCADYRRLNDVTVFDPFPMAHVEDLIEKVGSARWISTIDLTKGYWQIPLSPDAREKSAFVTTFGCFEFQVMPFGMQNAPATFMRLMRKVLDGAESYADALMDDLVIFSNTWEDHIKHLEDVFGRLQQAGLRAKPTKCQLGKWEVSYLGHIVGNGMVKPQPSKVEAIANYQRPTTKKDVRAFLGLAGYYRRFIPNFSAKACPLTDLTKKGQSSVVKWTEACEKAFNELKAHLSSESVLANPDFGRPFTLQVDASDRGLGAVLSQTDDQGNERPVTYLSRKLLPRETSYPTVEKECLAIVWATQALHPYLYGRHFTIQTDHHPLTWLNRVRGENQKLLRWSLALQQYHYDLVHRKGVENGNADGLSRGCND